MAEQRQAFRFRLPWLPAAPQPTPAPPRPSQATQAPPQPAPAQRPPFRAGGVSRAQPSTRPESKSSSQARTTSQPPAQIQGPKPSQSPQASPTRAAPKSKVSTTSPPKPSEAASKAQKTNIQRSDPKGPTELGTRVPAPELEVNQTTSEGRSRVPRGMNHDEPKEKKVIDSRSSPLTSKPKGHPVVIQDEQVQHPSGEVFERKVVTETFENSRHHTVPDTGTDEVGKFPQKPALHRDIKEGSQRLLHKLGARGDKHPPQEKPFSIITLAGENTGATMHLSSDSAKREQSIHIHRGYKINRDESVETATDGEGSSRGRNSGDSKLEEELTSKLYVNNNAQGVNNSLIYNSSVTEGNPGVHVVVSHNSEGPIKPGKERETVRAQKAEVASTTSEKLAYAPTVRRRCLRGLFLESSDSDPENPAKPRRHGCRVGCAEKGKDAKIDVL